jgi:transglutaminase-like putative cysteine protease
MNRTVACRMTAEVLAPATVELQVAVAGHGPGDERLLITLDGDALTPTALVTEAGGRLHVVCVGAGRLDVSYRAQTVGRSEPVAPGSLDATTYLRPSRYAESDRLAGFAQAELGRLSDPAELLRAVAAWVGTRLTYVQGSSSGTDGAVDTLLAGEGVCRDYAHLTVALLRARDVPARVVAVYAPGLDPMDFHAVVEALVDGVWRVVDPTLLAPRTSLIRIATGRDAADTAFLSSYGGGVRLDTVEVSATVDPELPSDDLDDLVSLG